MLRHEPLEVQKLDDTAETEPAQEGTNPANREKYTTHALRNALPSQYAWSSGTIEAEATLVFVIPEHTVRH
jgi:hypothetical protein